MNTVKRALHKIDHGLVMVDRAIYGHSGTDSPVFTLDRATVNKITKFREHYPDITQEFVDREINAALSDAVERMIAEYNGNV